MLLQRTVRRLSLVAGAICVLQTGEVLAGPFGMADPSFGDVRFIARGYPMYCFFDGRNGLLWSFVNDLPNNLIGANDQRVGGLVRTTVDGIVDTNFVVGPGLQDSFGVAVQADGKILVGGRMVGDLAINGSLNYRVFRFLTNGVIDATYHSPVFANPPRFMAVQPDGKLLAAAENTSNNGPAANGGVFGLARLNSDGSNDATFHAPSFTGGIDYGVFAPVVLDTNGMIYLAGAFTAVNGQARLGMARLQPNGDLDPTFVPSGYTFSTAVRGVVLQAGGKVVITGRLRLSGDPTFTGYPLIRLNADGSLDGTFNLVPSSSINFYRAELLQATADNKLLVVGTSMARFNSDGTLDNTFARLPFADASGNTGVVECYSFALLPDGRMIVPSDPSFGIGPSMINSQPFNGAVRLLSDGAFDSTFSQSNFQIGIFPTITVLESDGRLLVGGPFDHVGTNYSPSLMRLNTNGAPDSSYNLTLSNVLSILGVQAAPSNECYVLLQAGDSTLASTSNLLVRLAPNGATDPGFNVDQLAINSNGFYFTDLLLLGGLPVAVGSPSAQALMYQTNVPIARFLADGQRDGSFQADIPPPGYDVDYNGLPITNWDTTTIIDVGELFVGDFQILAALPDDKLLGAIGSTATGDFYSYQLVRLNANGTLDGTFVGPTVSPAEATFASPAVYDLSGNYGQVFATYPVRCITSAIVQSNGDILVAGNFTNVNGAFRPGIARLRPDATLDPSFPVGGGPVTPGGLAPIAISGLSTDATGKIWVSGNFVTWDGVNAPGYVRLKMDGGVDAKCLPQSTHYPIADYYVFADDWPLFNPFSGTLPAGTTQCYVTGPHLISGDSWPRALSRLVNYPPPRLNPIWMLGGQGFGMNFISLPGQSYIIQTSPDLSTWQDWLNFVGNGGEVQFSDPASLSLTQRFYRVVYQ